MPYFPFVFLLVPFLYKEKAQQLSILPYSISKNSAPSRSMSSPKGAMKSMA